MKNYVELSSELNWKSFINFMSSRRDNFSVENTHLTCHFRTAIAFRADAGNHASYFHLSANENEVLSLEKSDNSFVLAEVFRQTLSLKSFVLRFTACTLYLHKTLSTNKR